MRIDAGFEQNYYVQLNRGENHYINDARIQNPPSAFNPKLGPTPLMDCLYELESRQTPVTEKSEFGTVEYFSVLPPFRRTIYIDRFIDPWWHDPAKAATRPDPQMLPKDLVKQYRR